jgi:hypothetical protein
LTGRLENVPKPQSGFRKSDSGGNPDGKAHPPSHGAFFSGARTLPVIFRIVAAVADD